MRNAAGSCGNLLDCTVLDTVVIDGSIIYHTLLHRQLYVSYSTISVNAKLGKVVSWKTGWGGNI